MNCYSSKKKDHLPAFVLNRFSCDQDLLQSILQRKIVFKAVSVSHKEDLQHAACNDDDNEGSGKEAAAGLGRH